jgi:hypothetical protein
MKFINSFALTVIALCLIKISFWDSLIGIKPNIRPAAENSSEGNMFSSFKVGDKVWIELYNEHSGKEGFIKEIYGDSLALYWVDENGDPHPSKDFRVFNGRYIVEIFKI